MAFHIQKRKLACRTLYIHKFTQREIKHKNQISTGTVMDHNRLEMYVQQHSIHVHKCDDNTITRNQATKQLLQLSIQTSYIPCIKSHPFLRLGHLSKESIHI
jgi:hypothetical protein